MFRFLKRKPITRRMEYLKFGFVKTATIQHFCPRCKEVLNAGPNYQPNYCDRCGQRVAFDGVVWTPEESLGYASDEERSTKEVV